MKKKNWMSIAKKNITKCKKVSPYNYKKLFLFRKLVFFSEKRASITKFSFGRKSSFYFRKLG